MIIVLGLCFIIFGFLYTVSFSIEYLKRYPLNLPQHLLPWEVQVFGTIAFGLILIGVFLVFDYGIAVNFIIASALLIVAFYSRHKLSNTTIYSSMHTFLKRFYCFPKSGKIDTPYTKQQIAGRVNEIGYSIISKYRDELIKQLFVYRCLNSGKRESVEMRNYVRSEMVAGKEGNLEEAMRMVTDITFDTMPEMEILALPEATIAVISESYHLIKRQNKVRGTKAILQEVDKARNSTYLQTLFDKELTLESYILHVFNQEHSSELNKLESLEIMREQIRLANEFGQDYDARQQVAERDFT